ncbi:pentatricopeptide repeat-containing family protein [Hibiscus syriacus]|uniref:Pentatricopeptide repeat-containing family protein n=1 Tax=Hibiscus syriacus TaxID=106335 RepID=A0A6A2WWG0_HIBSY|nr:pentatricopeptide repeat-containing family protein [Hibiscus syriacus]
MVVKMMRWRPWPPLVSKKYEVKLVVRRLEGWDLVGEGWEKLEKVKVEVLWKGPKASLSSFRRTVKRNFTKEVDGVGENGVVGSKSKVPVVGTASLNLAEYASAAEQKEFELNIPLVLSTGAVELGLQLCISLSLLELRTTQETYESVERALVPVASPVVSGETVAMEKDEISAIKAGLRKVNFFKEYVSARGVKKACRGDEGSEGRCSARSDDGEYPLDTDSLDGSEEGESDEVKEDNVVRNMRISEGDEDWVYYSNRKSDVGCSNVEDSATPVLEPSLLQSSKRSILSWRKRKLSFRSPKAKGEPLLKKGNGEGGDDIDFDRRQLSSDESHAPGSHKGYKDSSPNHTSVSEFGDDNFAIGNWEQKEVVSRDGNMKLQSQVFFASIDQRSERAAGESACTALVAVIADWLQNNRDMMPIKTQFDCLIREGSLEWRSLLPRKSFIGFFHPEGMDEGRFDFCMVQCLSITYGMKLVVLVRNVLTVINLRREALRGCNQAYILKFDRNTVIHKLPHEAQSSDDKPTGAEVIKPEKSIKSEDSEEVVCQGKESCKEYIKSFLAAIPIRELQADIKKGLMASTPLHHRLQIEFHYTEFLHPPP